VKHFDRTQVLQDFPKISVNLKEQANFSYLYNYIIMKVILFFTNLQIDQANK
jgi:hypothetical protein